ncbi:hypothetical protein N7535_004343 [Penicillium sp. DV-2018c]|nr:hypothetical protein N7461_007927 [Penicillium sp. DV-2018c]KAJ5570683.1 hypothetical protein N7535_004343 [Penicillium sp. DV-2018c]
MPRSEITLRVPRRPGSSISTRMTSFIWCLFYWDLLIVILLDHALSLSTRAGASESGNRDRDRDTGKGRQQEMGSQIKVQEAESAGEHAIYHIYLQYE